MIVVHKGSGYYNLVKRPGDIHTDYYMELNVDLEYTNLHDENAALDFPPEIRQNVTDQSRFLRLCDIAGLPIGHVPRGLAGAFRKIIELEALHPGKPQKQQVWVWSFHVTASSP
ncbi:hypothetical protein DPMN_050067, partial [Dreissena polymorpha]